MGTFAETAISDYCLSFVDQGKQTSVFNYFCSKQMEDCRFRFPFAENNGSCHFPLVPFSVHGNMETWAWRHGDMGTWRHGYTDTRILGDTETWGDGDMETWRLRHGDIDIETKKHGEMET
jgi:hypothetical protein